MTFDDIKNELVVLLFLRDHYEKTPSRLVDGKQIMESLNEEALSKYYRLYNSLYVRSIKQKNNGIHTG